MNNQFMMNNLVNNQMIKNNNNYILNNQMNNMMYLLLTNTMNHLKKLHNRMKNRNNNETVNQNNTNNSNENRLINKVIIYNIIDPKNTNDIRITIVFITPIGHKVLLNTPYNKKLGNIYFVFCKSLCINKSF